MDLNLLRIFVAVYEEETVTRAAERLHMAQPSVTQALNRLRRTVGEPLFVRSGRGIQPTRTARQLYKEVGAIPAKAESAVRRLSNFDPADTQETFYLALTDLGQTIFLPALHRALRRLAPRSELDVVNLDVERVVDLLESGEVDLAVSSTILSEKLPTAVIREDFYCCVTRRDRFKNKPPSLSDIASTPRIVVKDRIGHTIVESKLPPAPPSSLHLTAFAPIPAILAQTDLIAFVPGAVVELWLRSWELDAWPLPRTDFGSSVHAHIASTPRSASSAWFTNWAIATLQEDSRTAEWEPATPELSLEP